MPLALLLPLAAQAAITGSAPGNGPALPQAPLEIHHPQARPKVQAPSLLQQCLSQAKDQPAQAIALAEQWLAKAKTMADRAGANQCKGLALVQGESFAQAAPLFLAARDNTPANESDERARLAALAGNAALAGGDPAAALTALDTARADAGGAGDPELRGGIAADRARALVALGRADEAALALADARQTAPGNAQAWLLSATLSRRQGRLGEAQQQIERAAQLLPVDPAIGLEAGVIAVLAGRDEAARKSWQSVIAADPGGPYAKVAQGYLDQLGPPAAPSAK